MAIITAEKLTKRFGKITALENVSVRIPKGFTLIIGPNGGGKSTFLKIAVGVYRPTAGKVEVLGKDPWSDEEVKRRIGVSFDPPALPPFRSAREWLETIAEIKELEKREIQRICNEFELGSFINRLTREYSAGMLKRVGLAQAFLGDPDLIFLDEPLVNIDVDGMKQVIELLSSKAEESNFVVISHIWRPLLPLADFVIFFSGGKIKANGTPEEISEILREYGLL
ncbi:ABC transporter, ATP-binding protein [Thermococcus sp. 2319x1]|uniref:ABC transporter ATP-binding protein n=1 Tax=Thermococcus sp. 2319x1 TaxID=1674923 RepID=UPI00073A7F84|nr:ABC transporter, ATP-binding protein [Thermococcus sp. 2319x1]